MEIKKILKYGTSDGQMVDSYLEAKSIEAKVLGDKLAKDLVDTDPNGPAFKLEPIASATFTELVGRPSSYLAVLASMDLPLVEGYLDEHPDWEKVEGSPMTYRHTTLEVILFQDAYEARNNRWAMKASDTDLSAFSYFSQVTNLEMCVTSMITSEH